MIDWNQVAEWFFGSSGILGPSILFIRWLWKRHAGQLTRAELQNARADKADRLSARYLAYIYLLRARWPAGTPLPPWPRGLKPRDD